jgi:hypothetical protein
MSIERLKNAALVFCLFIVLVVIFSSYFRASEVSTFFGALAGTLSWSTFSIDLLPGRSCRPGKRTQTGERKTHSCLIWMHTSEPALS